MNFGRPSGNAEARPSASIVVTRSQPGQDFPLRNPFWADLLAWIGKQVKVTACTGVFEGELLAVDMMHFNLELRLASGKAYFRGDSLQLVELLP